MWHAFISGFGVSLGLILAIGAQNAFVLRQGLRGAHVWPVVLVCSVSDALLIMAGVTGFATASKLVPGLVPVIKLGGAAFLFIYGALNLRRALFHSGESLTPDAHHDAPLAQTLGVCLALTWLNPHVYLDTVMLIGSTSAGFGDLRWVFAAGAVLASFAFFHTLGFGAAFLRPLFAKPAAWQVLDIAIGLTMWAIAVSLLRA